jgi:hypothetical protein
MLFLESHPTLMLISFIIHSLQLKSEQLEFKIDDVNGAEMDENYLEPQKTFNFS